MRGAYPKAEIVQDIGSGLNFKRKGLRSILGRLLRGEKLEVVVAHRDRLARFGVGLLDYLIEATGGTLVVLDKRTDATPEGELTEDLLAILHHFSCRMHGHRSHANKKDTSLPRPDPESSFPEMVRSLALRIQSGDRESEETEPALDGTVVDFDACAPGMATAGSLRSKE